MPGSLVKSRGIYRSKQFGDPLSGLKSAFSTRLHVGIGGIKIGEMLMIDWRCFRDHEGIFIPRPVKSAFFKVYTRAV